MNLQPFLTPCFYVNRLGSTVITHTSKNEQSHNLKL